MPPHKENDIAIQLAPIQRLGLENGLGHRRRLRSTLSDRVLPMAFHDFACHFKQSAGHGPNTGLK
jgi:hypothetical protein